jgi:alpha-amylase/alpha-mannosidase (GH57 family)
MPNSIRLVLALHNHQPVGNFEHVFQQAYEDSYLPFLELFSRYETLRIALHTSGSLMEWFDTAHPEYVDRLADLAAKGRIEIIGGAFFEPILAMIPSRDRVGQIRKYSRWLQNRLGTTVRGMWMPERVWEQSFAGDLVDAGIEYTILDDFHFKMAGLTDSQLQGYLVTEDEGRLLNVFPGSERLRYTIPFASPEETIEHLARLSEQRPGAICLFGDDGEKFGTWPETKKHVYEDGWLTRFFDALVANQSWLQITTPSEAIDNVPPVGKVYLPDCSYREMTEWALPTQQLIEYERITHEMHDDARLAALKRFVRGGFWRNFKVKYPEADEMYCRMMMVSRRLQDAIDDGATGKLVEAARTELYRAQCNCSHWHGAFGGIYLPHLRNAVYCALIAADGILDRAARRPETWVEATADDYNFDARQEICLSNDRMMALVFPSRGGTLAELDVRSIRHNLLATLSRQPEAYHRKVLAGANQQNGQCASIHDRVVFKQANLDQRIQYDKYPRKALVDLFFDNETTLDVVAAGQAELRSDFTAAVYEAKIRRNAARIQVQLVREGQACGVPVRITKGLTLDTGSSTLKIAYLLENLPQDRPLHFAVEMNFAGLPSGADDRYFHDSEGNRLGQLGARLDLGETTGLYLCDEWLGIDVGLTASRPTSFWTFPIETVSQSEGGFELVHQSTAVLPHWYVTGDRDGRWSVAMQLNLDTSRAEQRVAPPRAATAAVGV